MTHPGTDGNSAVLPEPTLAEDVAFKARALAQAHPMSGVALTYRAELIVRERRDQPVPELADWAAGAFLVGYCVRRVEETTARPPTPIGPVALGARIDQEDVVAIVRRFNAGEAVGLLADDILVEVLDRVIATEVDKRNEHVREHLDAGQWNDFEAYVAWWVLHGWATRVAERSSLGESANESAGKSASESAGENLTCAS